jgi:hypothetical protein
MPVVEGLIVSDFHGETILIETDFGAAKKN